MSNPRGLSRETVVLAVIGLIAIAVLAWAVGLEWPEAILVALSAVAVLGLRRLPVTNADDGWPALPDDADDRGVRRDVTRLSWTLHGYEARVERPSVRRLRAVAARRLAARGLDLESPADAEACRTALGETAYAVVNADSRAQVDFDTFTEAVAAVEQLSPERLRS